MNSVESDVLSVRDRQELDVENMDYFPTEFASEHEQQNSARNPAIPDDEVCSKLRAVGKVIRDPRTVNSFLYYALESTEKLSVPTFTKYYWIQPMPIHTGFI